MTIYNQTRSLVPAIYSAGLFKCYSPFDSLVSESKQYECQEIRSVAELKRLNVDIHSLVFGKLTIDRDTSTSIMEDCELLNGVVVTLIGHDNVPVYVPSTFFESIPITDGIPYEICALLVNLGSISEDEKNSLESLNDKIRDYVFAALGINATVSVGGVGYRTYVSKEQHEQIQLAREQAITEEYPDVIKIEELEEKIKDQDIHILALEEIIKSYQ